MFCSSSLKLAAAAVLVCAGILRAEDKVVYADDEQATKPRMPLMSALDKVGAGRTLDQLGITTGGYVEGSWTYNFARPRNQINVFVDREVDASKGKFDIGGRVEWIFGADSRFFHSSGLNFYGPGDADRGGQPFPNNQFDLN